MRWLRGVLLLLLIGCVLFVVDRQLAGDLHPDGTTLALLLIGVALSLGLLYPAHFDELFGRLTAFKVGSLELNWSEVEGSEAGEQLPKAGESVQYGTAPIPPRKKTGSTSGDLEVIRRELVDRLHWLAVEVSIGSTDPPEIVQQLRAQELLDDQQAGFAMDLLTPGYEDISRLPVA